MCHVWFIGTFNFGNGNEYIGDGEVRRIVETLFKKANIKLMQEKPDKYEETLEYITNDVIEYYHNVGNCLTIIDSEYPFYIKGKDYSFSGIVDLIYEQDGKLGLMDYKNTKLVSDEYLAKYKKQLHYYVMALRDENNEFEGRKIEEIKAYAIKYKAGDKLFPFDIDEDYIVELEKELAETARKIKNNEFEANCDDCSGCQFRKICKK